MNAGHEVEAPQAAEARITDWTTLPLYVTTDEVAAVFQKTRKGIERLVRLGRFPRPVFTRPARWSRAELEAWWKGETTPVELRRRKAW